MKIDAIIRTVLLGLALVNQVFTMCGLPLLNIENETVTNLLTCGFTVVMAVINWWKNNSITDAAKTGDKIMYYIKSGAASSQDIIDEVFDTTSDWKDEV